MQHILTKKHVGYILGAALALTIGSLMFVGVHDVGAQALTADDLFGGENSDGLTFDEAAGLGDADLVDTISGIIRIALGFLGIIAVVIILLGGFKWMTAGGAEDKVKDAKRLIYSGIIGMVIVLTSFAIATFVIDSIMTATS